MIENLPFHVPATFILTTFLTFFVFIHALKRGAFSSVTTRILIFLLPFWLLFQASLAITGFYTKTDSMPPRFPVFAVAPALLAIVLLFIFSRKDLIDRLPLKTLTWIHVIRIPVEIVLHQLYLYGLIPQLMTFEGRNFDIISGITAPLITWLAFRGGIVNRPLLIGWNVFALLLLINIVLHAFLSFETPLQQLAFEQPNRAVQYFPYVWLPTLVVPIVLFSHLASLYQLLKSPSKP